MKQGMIEVTFAAKLHTLQGKLDEIYGKTGAAEKIGRDSGLLRVPVLIGIMGDLADKVLAAQTKPASPATVPAPAKAAPVPVASISAQRDALRARIEATTDPKEKFRLVQNVRALDGKY